MSDSMYLTGNPVPSADPRDRWDNGISLDEIVSGDLEVITTRTGKSVYTLAYLNRMLTQARGQIDATVNSVNSEANQAKVQIKAAVSGVNDARDAATVEIGEIIAGLGEDINTAHADTLEDLKLKSPKYAGLECSNHIKCNCLSRQPNPGAGYLRV